jgi:hypothetical protein
MEQRRSWEADSHSAGQEYPRILWNPKFPLLRSHEPTIGPYRIQLNPFYNSHRLSTLILSSSLSLRIQSGVFSRTKCIYLLNYILVYKHMEKIERCCSGSCLDGFIHVQKYIV